MSLSAYENNLDLEVLSATPLQLVQLLYRGALQAVHAAIGCLEAGEIRGRSRQIDKACAILEELTLSLDREKGGEIARNLGEIYGYLHGRLLDANIRQVREPLDEVVKHLATLQQAWQQLAAVPQDPGAMSNADLTALAASVGTAETEFGELYAGRPLLQFTA